MLFEDSASLVGLFIAFVGTYLSIRLDFPILDGVASILIGLVLAATAALLARETKGLLIGEGADQPIVDSIIPIAEEMEGIAHANGVITVHLGPEQIVVSLSLEFADELRTPEIEVKVIELERRVRHLHPAVIALFVKPQSSSGYKDTLEVVSVIWTNRRNRQYKTKIAVQNALTDGQANASALTIPWCTLHGPGDRPRRIVGRRCPRPRDCGSDRHSASGRSGPRDFGRGNGGLRQTPSPGRERGIARRDLGGSACRRDDFRVDGGHARREGPGTRGPRHSLVSDQAEAIRAAATVASRVQSE